MFIWHHVKVQQGKCYFWYNFNIEFILLVGCQLVVFMSQHYSDNSSNEEAVPCTSKPCKWKQPHKRKSSTQLVSTACFEKHEYGKTRKYTFESQKAFDPWPQSMQNTASKRLPQPLQDVRGKAYAFLCSDSSHQSQTPAASPHLTKVQLLEEVRRFKKTLEVSWEDVRRIQIETCGQSTSPQRFKVRRLHLTSSLFGCVRQLKPSTPPDNLVLPVLGVKVLRVLDWAMEGIWKQLLWMNT